MQMSVLSWSRKVERGHKKHSISKIDEIRTEASTNTIKILVYAENLHLPHCTALDFIPHFSEFFTWYSTYSSSLFHTHTHFWTHMFQYSSCLSVMSIHSLSLPRFPHFLRITTCHNRRTSRPHPQTSVPQRALCQRKLLSLLMFYCMRRHTACGIWISGPSCRGFKTVVRMRIGRSKINGFVNFRNNKRSETVDTSNLALSANPSW